MAAFEEEFDGDTASLILNQRDDAPKGRENTELVMAQGKLVINSIAGAPVPLVEAAFVHDKGSSGRAVEACFTCPIRYGAERNALTFDRALLDRRIEKSDVAYHALIKKYLATARAEIEGGTTEDVRAEIARQMELGHCTLERVADSLRMPPRSLQRRLQTAGLSFRDLVDEWRRARALSLVTNTRRRCRRCPRRSAIPSRACSPRHSAAGTAERRIGSGRSDWRQAPERARRPLILGKTSCIYASPAGAIAGASSRNRSMIRAV